MHECFTCCFPSPFPEKEYIYIYIYLLFDCEKFGIKALLEWFIIFRLFLINVVSGSKRLKIMIKL